jgi:hypothetical protein
MKKEDRRDVWVVVKLCNVCQCNSFTLCRWESISWSTHTTWPKGLLRLLRRFYLTVLRIRDVYPGSRNLIFTHPGSRISDPGSKSSNKREGWKKFVVIPFYVDTNFTKFKVILVLKWWRKNFGPIFKDLQNFLPKKLSLSSQKYGLGSGIWDPGSEIRDREKTCSGSRIQGSKRHRIPDPDPQHWFQFSFNFLNHWFAVQVPREAILINVRNARKHFEKLERDSGQTRPLAAFPR